MFAGILLLFSAFSLYTTVVQARDSQATFVSHILQLRGNAYGISPCKIMCLASVFRHTRWRVPYKTSRKLSLTYLSLLLVTLSSEIELNPGPSFPCGSCGIEVLDDDDAVSCDNCDYWYHIQCQNISTGTYETFFFFFFFYQVYFRIPTSCLHSLNFIFFFFFFFRLLIYSVLPCNN